MQHASIVKKTQTQIICESTSSYFKIKICSLSITEHQKNSKLRNIKQYYCACATTMDYTIECKAI